MTALPALDRRQLLALATYAAAAGTLPRSAWGAPTLRHNPFSLGVASGDPTPDGFVLWTRLLPGADPLPAQPIALRWEIAHDAAFQQIALLGSTLAQSALAHSVHVEVKGLEPGRWYHYRFLHGDAASAVGRAQTAPAAGTMPARLKLAFASCQRWETGFYAAWAHVAREAPDLVLFLGDYIYEYATPPNTNGLARTHGLRHAQTLADYRDRYALHKSDPQLQAAHAACPWAVTWDDHEVQNDYVGITGRWEDDDFTAMRAAAYQAFYEHMPLRLPHGAATTFNTRPLFRRIEWGQLAQLHVLDGRQFRDRQACRRAQASGAGAVKPGTCAELSQPQRSFLGHGQERWLDSGLAHDAQQDTAWSVLAQQTLFSPRRYPSGVQSTDTWDGYPAARQRLTASIARHTAGKTVLLGGDIHQNYVCRVGTDQHAPQAGASIASEFCGTSISSRAGTTQDKVDAIVRRNPHVLWARCEERGYGMAEVTAKRWTTTLQAVDEPMRADSGVHVQARFVVEPGGGGPVRTG